MWIKIFRSSLKSFLSELVQHQGQQFISKFASSVVSRFAITSWFSKYSGILPNNSIKCTIKLDLCKLILFFMLNHNLLFHVY